ncbi:efflux RND transporter periplasmic adaptor subunit [Variovorax sp. J22R24]|uniref:efflux RND transporter periplasmic adaptor subunit n=1 Tax=Variovorax gracilis TaxID=3053502 RepID=UPI002578147A|nr:efflux RND transporter periplasmic adaptor subunit [Variovorax sp. J22R24]MDM0105431.1 efflux RND transporter periplasmic adaptor subunit [Variovorax sp. J22R24]
MSVKSTVQRVGHLHRTTTVLALAALALLSACKRGEEAPVAEIRPVRVMTIETRSIGDIVTLTGTVQAQTEINQSFRIDGRLVERNVEIGDRVKPGQVLARLDPLNEESSLQSARAQLTAAQAQSVEARNNHRRLRDLLKEDAVSRASFEQAEALLKVAQSQVESAQSLVTLAQNRLSYTRLVSDVSGIVTARGPEPGEVVQAGRMIIQVAREGARDAVFDVPAQVKNSAPSDPEITVSLVSDPNIIAKGQVREVSPRADPVTGTFSVRVRLINAPTAMRLGTTVNGRMKLDSAPAIDIPASALTRSGKSASVWVVDPKAGTVSARAIEVRAYDAARVQVTSGLAPGDVVVTAGVQALRPGQKVRMLEAAQ